MKHLIKLTKRMQLQDFLEVCLDCRSSHELEELMCDIFSQQELVALSERWSIAKLLHMGFSYRTIHKKIGSSAATIARMARVLMNGTGGLRRACHRRSLQFVNGQNGDPAGNDTPFPVFQRAFQ